MLKNSDSNDNTSGMIQRPANSSPSPSENVGTVKSQSSEGPSRILLRLRAYLTFTAKAVLKPKIWTKGEPYTVSRADSGSENTQGKTVRKPMGTKCFPSLSSSVKGNSSYPQILMHVTGNWPRRFPNETCSAFWPANNRNCRRLPRPT